MARPEVPPRVSAACPADDPCSYGAAVVPATCERKRRPATRRKPSAPSAGAQRIEAHAARTSASTAPSLDRVTVHRPGPRRGRGIARLGGRQGSSRRRARFRASRRAGRPRSAVGTRRCRPDCLQPRARAWRKSSTASGTRAASRRGGAGQRRDLALDARQAAVLPRSRVRRRREAPAGSGGRCGGRKRGVALGPVGMEQAAAGIVDRMDLQHHPSRVGVQPFERRRVEPGRKRGDRGLEQCRPALPQLRRGSGRGWRAWRMRTVIVDL